MKELEFATKTARKSQAKDRLTSSETYGQGKMKSGRAAKDMRIKRSAHARLINARRMAA